MQDFTDDKEFDDDFQAEDEEIFWKRILLL